MSSSVPARMKVIGRYRLLAKIGRGGMAEVYLAAVKGSHDTTKLVVLKLLRPELAIQPEFREMFGQEARLAARLNHPNLPQTFEVGDEAGVDYMAMEYLEGQSLFVLLERVGRNKVPLDSQVQILSLVLSGLHYAHELTDFDGKPMNVVHRDVSPQNVFVTYDGHVKVVDFGIAKVSGGTVATATGIVKGKIAYMAPEQALSLPVERRADVFSVGVMLWEAITGERFAPSGDGEQSNLRRLLSGEIRSPRPLARGASEELLAACERSMAYEPDGRFATAREFHEVLEAYLEKGNTRVTASKIGALVSGAFTQERAKLRAVVDGQLSASRREGEVTLVDVGKDVSLAPSAETRHFSGRKTRALWILGAAVGVGVAMAALLKIPSRRTVTASPAAGSSAPAAPLVTVAPSSTATAAPLVAASARVRLLARPATAKISLDGKPLNANPFAGALPKSERPERLVVQAPGFVSESRDIVLDHDIDIEISLLKDTAALPKAAGGAARSADAGARVAPRSVDDQDPYR